MTQDYIPTYVAGELSALAGSSVGLCDSRGEGTNERFTLRDVPETLGFETISRTIAQGHGFEDTALVPSSTNDPTHYSAILHAGGRTRQPYASLSVTRRGHRVWVDISPLHS